MNIGIIGLGLIGGSLAKALKSKATNINIIAFDKDIKSLEDAKNDKNIDQYTTAINSSFENCDIVFLCTPVNISISYIKKISEIVNEDCLITDVSSSKGEIFNETNKIKNINFIGGHPMTGSEQSGYKSSKTTLFENAFYIVTPSENITEIKLNILKEIIQKIGAIYVELSAEEHDKCVAIISHMPHIIASCLVNFVKDQDNSDQILKTLSAGGFKDITRIASSSGELWHSIILSNREYVSNNLKLFIYELKKICDIIDDDEQIIKLIDYINDGKVYRNSFKNTANYLKLYNISVDVPDEPNVIGIIATILGENKINIKNIGINNNREENDYALTIAFHDEISMKNAGLILENINYKTKEIK